MADGQDLQAVATGAVEAVPGMGTAATANGDGGQEEPRGAGTKAPEFTGNLDDIPAFREAKSKFDKQIADLARQAKAAEQARNGDRQRAQWLEAELEKLRTQGMDEPQRAAYEREKLHGINQQLMNEITRMRAEQIRTDAMLQMQQQARDVGINVSLADLQQHETADSAWLYLLQQSASQRGNASAAQARQEKLEANAPHLGSGGGGGNTGKEELQARYDRAAGKYDAARMLEILQEAAIAGHELTI